MTSQLVYTPRDGSPRIHRAPQHTRFQHPTPPGCSTASSESALPRFWSAVPRTNSAAGNLRLHHPLGYIAPRSRAFVPNTLHSRFQSPVGLATPMASGGIMPVTEEPGASPRSQSSLAFSSRLPAEPTFSTINEPPRAHKFGLWGCKQPERPITTRWEYNYSLHKLKVP